MWQSLRAKFDREEVTARMQLEEVEYNKKRHDDSIDEAQRRILVEKAMIELAKGKPRKKDKGGFEKEQWKGSAEEIWVSRYGHREEESTLAVSKVGEVEDSS
ncbi:unnamed protein product [Linum trigynum]